MYFITTPQDEWSFRGAGAAAAGGTGSGGLSSLSGSAKPLDGLGASVVKNTVAGGASALGGFVDNGIAGEEYSAGEMIFDGLAGVASSKFPGAEELGGANASWGSHIGAAYAGGHVSAITDSVKFVGEQVGAPW
jgi:hypothetical protein